MAFSFAEFTTAVATYPETNVAIEIVDVAFTSGNALNIEEEATFKVKITNSGPLDLTDVTVRVKGLNGAQLRTSLIAEPNPDPLPRSRAAAAAAVAVPVYVDDLVSEVIPLVGAHGGSKTTETFTFKAPRNDSNGSTRNLVKASLEGWNGSLNHMLLGHSDPLESVNGIYGTVVSPA
jgi:hypothetical protein